MWYQTPGPTREEIDGSTGAVLLDFGTDWCGQVEDGLGRRPV
jgi:hypothetical protein